MIFQPVFLSGYKRWKHGVYFRFILKTITGSCSFLYLDSRLQAARPVSTLRIPRNTGLKHGGHQRTFAAEDAEHVCSGPGRVFGVRRLIPDQRTAVARLR